MRYESSFLDKSKKMSIVGLSPIMVYILEMKISGFPDSTTTVENLVGEFKNLPHERRKSLTTKAKNSQVRIRIPRHKSPFEYFLVKHPNESAGTYLALTTKETKKYILQSYSEEYSQQIHFGYAMRDDYIRSIHTRRMYDAMRIRISGLYPSFGEKSLHSSIDGEISRTLGNLSPDDVEVYNTINDQVKKMYNARYLSFMNSRVEDLKVPAGFE